MNMAKKNIPFRECFKINKNVFKTYSKLPHIGR
jgi:hypothetical protein